MAQSPVHNTLLPHGIFCNGGLAVAGVEALCVIFRCDQELGDVSLSPWETQHDLAAHLIFRAGQRDVSQVNQRQNGIDPDIDGINDWSHGIGVAEVSARKNLVSCVETILTPALIFQADTRKP